MIRFSVAPRQGGAAQFAVARHGHAFGALCASTPTTNWRSTAITAAIPGHVFAHKGNSMGCSIRETIAMVDASFHGRDSQPRLCERVAVMRARVGKRGCGFRITWCTMASRPPLT